MILGRSMILSLGFYSTLLSCFSMSCQRCWCGRGVSRVGSDGAAGPPRRARGRRGRRDVSVGDRRSATLRRRTASGEELGARQPNSANGRPPPPPPSHSASSGAGSSGARLSARAADAGSCGALPAAAANSCRSSADDTQQSWRCSSS